MAPVRFHRTPEAATRYHARLRSSDELWPELPLVGLQRTVIAEYDLELRNCPLCGSTLARRVPKSGMGVPKKGIA